MTATENSTHNLVMFNHLALFLKCTSPYDTADSYKKNVIPKPKPDWMISYLKKSSPEPVE